MDNLTMTILTHAENALASGEQASEVLSMWIDSIPYGDERHAEACRVAAVISLVAEGVDELKKAVEVFDAAKKQ